MQQLLAGTKCDKSIETRRKDGAFGGYKVKMQNKTALYNSIVDSGTPWECNLMSNKVKIYCVKNILEMVIKSIKCCLTSK